MLDIVDNTRFQISLLFYLIIAINSILDFNHKWHNLFPEQKT